MNSKRVTEIEAEVKAIIIETLRLEDMTPDDISSVDPLFNDGLGLDSLDALELGIAISKKYDIKLKSDPEENQKIFASVNAMAQFVVSKTSNN